MGLYRREVYKKNRKGDWVLKSSKIENAPHEYGRWKRSNELEKRAGGNDKTYLKTSLTRTGLNYKVDKATTYFGENEKVVRSLITTSNRLPKNKKK